MIGRTVIGDWYVHWDEGWIARRRSFLRRRQYLDARILAVLKLLADKDGQTVSVEEMLQQVWPNRVVSRDSVSTAIYELRQILGDDSQRPIYVKTEGRRGYRLVSPITRVGRQRGTPVSANAVVITLIAICSYYIWNFNDGQESEPSLLLVERLQDQTLDGVTLPLHAAIESMLIGELVVQLPGRIISDSSKEMSALTLQTTIVACDLGPALVVNIVDSSTRRYLWSQVYRLDSTEYETDQPTLVHTVASDVGHMVRKL